MTGTEVALVITASATLVTSLGGFVIALRKIEGVKAHVQKVEHATNGLSERLGAAKLAQGEAQGHERGLQQGRDEIR